MAEGEGFEPPVRFPRTVVFKTTRFNRSRIPPAACRNTQLSFSLPLLSPETKHVDIERLNQAG